MAFQVLLLRRAQTDIDSIYTWLAKRSARGAANWYAAFLDAAAALERILFMIVGMQARVLRVRGPGQASLKSRDVR